MVLPPAGPPPPELPEGWKAHWNSEYKAWFYENIYTEESVWVKPTEPVYPAQSTARLPAGPPPGYQAVQQPAAEKSADPAALPSSMAAVSLSEGNPYSQAPQQPPTYGATAPQQPAAQTYPSPSPNPASLYGATPQAAAARAPSPQPPAPSPGPAEATRDYPQAPGYAPQQAQAPGYPPQPQYAEYQPQSAQPPGYPPQQAQAPGYPPQPQYAPQPQYGAPPQQAAPGAPAPKAGGFMGMLQNKVGGKVPGGANTVLGLGGGLLAGAVLEHEWDKHENRVHRHHGGFGGLGGLMRGFGGDSGGPVVENVTIDENVYVDDTTYINY